MTRVLTLIPILLSFLDMIESCEFIDKVLTEKDLLKTCTTLLMSSCIVKCDPLSDVGDISM